MFNVEHRENRCPCGNECRKGQGNCLACHRKANREYRLRHPLQGEARKKMVARSYAKVYERRGKLLRQPCEVCASILAEKHHEDYDRPLQVRWLCRKCHLEEHKRERIKLLIA